MNSRGVTLVELMVGTAILGIVGLIVYDVYLAASRFSHNEQLRIEVDLSASRILSTMDTYLRQGVRVYDSHIFDDGTTVITGSSELVFGIPSVAGSSIVDYVGYSLEGETLQMRLDPDAISSRSVSVTEVATRVQDVYFRYNTIAPSSATAVTVTVATAQSVSGDSYTQYAILNEIFKNHP